MRLVTALGVLVTPAALSAPQCIAYTEPASTADVSAALSGHFDWLNEHGYRTVAPDDASMPEPSIGATERRLVLVFPAANTLFRDAIEPQLSVFSFRAGVVDASEPVRTKGDTGNGTTVAGRRPLSMHREVWTSVRSSARIFQPVRISPQGDVGPGASGRAYLGGQSRYETVEEMVARIRGDLERDAASRASSTRTMLWPENEYSGAAVQVASDFGFSSHLVLSRGIDSPAVSSLVHCRPLSMVAPLSELARAVRPAETRAQRVLRLELDPGRLGEDGYAASIAKEVAVIRPSEVVVDALVSPGSATGGREAIFPSSKVLMAHDLLGHLIARLRSIDGLRTAVVMPVVPCPADKEVSLAEEIVASAPIDSLYVESEPFAGGEACPGGWSRLAGRLRHWRPELRVARALTQVAIDDYSGEPRQPSADGLPGTMIAIDADGSDRSLMAAARRFASNRPLMIDTIVMTPIGDSVGGTVAARTLREAGVLHRGVRVRLAFIPEQTDQLRRELSTEALPHVRQAAAGAATKGIVDSRGER